MSALTLSRLLPLLCLILLSRAAAAADTSACYAGPSAARAGIERACSDVIAMLGNAPDLSDQDRQAVIAAYNNRAISSTRAGELDSAAEDLSRALLLAPDSWALYLNRGNLNLARQDYAAALADFQQAARLAGDAAEPARRNAVLAYRGLGDLESAEATLAAVLARAERAPASDISGSVDRVSPSAADTPGLPARQRR